LWISAGSYSLNVVDYTLNTTVEFCANVTSEEITHVRPEDITGFDRIYMISYLWYPAIGMTIVVVLGLLVTMFTNCTDPSDVPSRYLIPVFNRLFCCLPNKTLRVLRCNKTLPEDEEDEEVKTVSLDDCLESGPDFMMKPALAFYDNIALEHDYNEAPSIPKNFSISSLPSYHSTEGLDDRRNPPEEQIETITKF